MQFENAFRDARTFSLLETNPGRISVGLPVEETPEHTQTHASSFGIKSAGAANTVDLAAPYSYDSSMSPT